MPALLVGRTCGGRWIVGPWWLLLVSLCLPVDVPGRTLVTADVVSGRKGFYSLAFSSPKLLVDWRLTPKSARWRRYFDEHRTEVVVARLESLGLCWRRRGVSWTRLSSGSFTRWLPELRSP